MQHVFEISKGGARKHKSEQRSTVTPQLRRQEKLSPEFGGVPILVPLEALRPTQVAVGMRAVAWKREKVASHVGKSKRIARFLDKRPIPSVVGPGGDLYMIDHHHLGLALWQADVGEAYVRIVEDFSALAKPAFWRKMEANGCLYPFDATGQRVRPSRLPAGLHALKEDPYRDLAWSVREAGGFEKSRIPYAEFRWAAFFRERISERTLRTNYDAAVAKAVRLCRSRDAIELPGYAACS